MKRCMGCMETYEEEYQVCPWCGYIEGTKPQEAIHMIPGKKLHDRYVIGKVLGYGGFGVTYIGWDPKLEQKVAIKEYMPAEFSTRMPGYSNITVFGGDKAEQFHGGKGKFIDEARRLAKFQNEPGIVSVFDSFEENDTAYIVMEYLEGRTLTDYLTEVKTIPEDKAVKMLLPVMESLKKVHEAGIIHRDIAPDNIFITKKGDVKLIDFGASRYATTTHSRSLTVIVKPGFSPEEQYRSRGDQGKHTDVYSLAATLYKMITGKTPPDAMERRAYYENKNKDILIRPHKLKKGVSPAREIALLNALNVRIEDRTPDVETFIEEITSGIVPKRRYGKIKKIDIYTMPLWFKSLAVTLALVFVAVTALIFTGVINFSLFSEKIIIPDGIVQVDDVEGEDRQDAIDILEGQGLIVYISEGIYTDYVIDNTIVTQTPLGGYYVEVGGIVKLCPAYGKVEGPKDGIATVPNISSMTPELAEKRLKEAGLEVDRIEYISDEYVEAGLVCKQSEESGTKISVGSRIIIYVSTGPAAFEMPDVVNMEYSEASSSLQKLGLKVTITKVYSETVPVGYVVSQSIAGGEQAKKGMEVIIEVSSDEVLFNVPDVEKKQASEAKELLKNSKFKYIVLENYDVEIEEGYVISQNPKGGTQASGGTEITLIVSKGKQPLNMSLDANGGNCDVSTKVVYYGKEYGDLPQPTKEGFVFEGWFSESEGGEQISSSSIVSKSGDFSIYAHWKNALHSVSFDGNGGTVDTTVIKIETGKALGGLPEARKDYCTFAGWYTDPTGGEPITSGTQMGDYDITAYAHWNSKEPTGNWVESSMMPDGSMVVEEKWTYTETEWVESDSPEYSGYTRDDSKTVVSYGDWSAWSESPIEANDSLEVKTEEKTVTTTYYTLGYASGMDGPRNTRYYYTNADEFYSVGFNGSPYCNYSYATVSEQELNNTPVIPSNSGAPGDEAGHYQYNGSDSNGYYYGGVVAFIQGSSTQDSKVTIYSCRTVNRKYSFYKQTDRESASMVSESENIKNIKYYVKYIEK